LGIVEKKMNRKSIILSIKGLKLSKEEYSLIQNEKPWGIILFKRNIKNINQVKSLTSEIKKAMNDSLYPILIDEEGGRVSRLSNIFDTKKFAQYFFGNLFEKNKQIGENIYEEYLYLICKILNNIGININTIPVLDILKNKTHKIIGDRSYSKNLKTIKSLGRICINVLNNYKIGSVSKHIPGHGCSNLDTHNNRAVVYDSYNELLKNDLNAFKKIKSHFVMTAHIVYKKIDPLNVATHSEIVIKNIIRKKLTYKGLILSDDISMKALGKNLLFNAKKAIQSGCNLALYCGGNIKESIILLKEMKKIDDFTAKKTSEFYKFLR
jgi:beta-N-acetylhexosaminidase